MTIEKLEKVENMLAKVQFIFHIVNFQHTTQRIQILN